METKIKKNEDKMYVDKKELLAEIIESKRLDELTRKAEILLIKLIENFINKHKRFHIKHYKNPDDKKDLLQNAFYVVFKQWRNFDLEKSDNAVAYFTEIAKRAATDQYLTLTNPIKNTKKEIKIKMISMNSSNDGDGMFTI
jgi:hypothetical protein